MKKCTNGEKGEILLFCLVVLLILMSVSSVLTVIVASRSTYVRKSADYNDNVLLLEDANIRYMGQLPQIQSETSDLVVYYFNNEYYNKQNKSYSGYLKNYDRYLKDNVDLSVQKMMFTYFKKIENEATTETTDPDTGEVTKVTDYESMENDVGTMSAYLYAHLLSRRFENPKVHPTQAADDISVMGRLEKITGKASDLVKADTVNGNIAAKYHSKTYGLVTFSMPLVTEAEYGPDKRLLKDSPPNSSIQYWTDHYATGNSKKKANILEATVYSNLKLDPGQMHIKGVSRLKQVIKAKMPVLDASASWNQDKKFYEVTFTLPDKIEPEVWEINSVK